jgi:hypothetical protein
MIQDIPWELGLLALVLVVYGSIIGLRQPPRRSKASPSGSPAPPSAPVRDLHSRRHRHFG